MCVSSSDRGVREALQKVARRELGVSGEAGEGEKLGISILSFTKLSREERRLDA
jgi:hypothetical protein